MKRLAPALLALACLCPAAGFADDSESVNPSPACMKSIDNLSLRGKLAFTRRELSLPDLIHIENAGASLVGKRVSILPLQGDAGGTSEIQVHVDAFRKAMIQGCEGVAGKLLSLDDKAISLQLKDGQVKVIDRLPYDEIYVQALE